MPKSELQVLDDILLMAVNPTGEHQQNQLKRTESMKTDATQTSVASSGPLRWGQAVAVHLAPASIAFSVTADLLGSTRTVSLQS